MNESQAPIPAAPEEVKYHKVIVLPDDEIDETESGECVFFDASMNGEIMANICMNARIKPLDFVRSSGKWFMAFDILPPEGGETEFSFAVEVEKEKQALLDAAAVGKNAAYCPPVPVFPAGGEASPATLGETSRGTVKRMAREEAEAAWKDLQPKAPGKQAWMEARAEADKWLSARWGLAGEIRHLARAAMNIAKTVKAPDYVLSPVLAKADELEKAAFELSVFFCTIQEELSERFSSALVEGGEG